MSALTLKSPTRGPFWEVMHHAESIRNDGEHTIYPEVGDAWAQGDILIVCEAGLPQGCVMAENPSPQLAPGTSQGSRHCLRAMDGVVLYRLENPNPLDGPIIVARKGCAIDHPEHGNVILPAGVYSISYQCAFAPNLRRVLD